MKPERMIDPKHLRIRLGYEKLFQNRDRIGDRIAIAGFRWRKSAAQISMKMNGEMQLVYLLCFAQDACESLYSFMVENGEAELAAKFSTPHRPISEHDAMSMLFEHAEIIPYYEQRAES